MCSSLGLGVEEHLDGDGRVSLPVWGGVDVLWGTPWRGARTRKRERKLKREHERNRAPPSTLPPESPFSGRPGPPGGRTRAHAPLARARGSGTTHPLARPPPAWSARALAAERAHRRKAERAAPALCRPRARASLLSQAPHHTPHHTTMPAPPTAGVKRGAGKGGPEVSFSRQLFYVRGGDAPQPRAGRGKKRRTKTETDGRQKARTEGTTTTHGQAPSPA